MRMQKKLIALAVASLVSAPVFAQSQVTIYGTVDEGVDSGNYGAGNVTRLAASGYTTERIGFKGVEDMGNGLKAQFMLEIGPRSDVGTMDNFNSQLFQRTSTVGLSGNSWGSVNFGRQYTPVFSMQAANDIFRIAGIGAGYVLGQSSGSRANNSIRYDGAKMGGFTISAMYSFGETPAAAGAYPQESTVINKDLGRATAIALRYAGGPLEAGIGYENVKVNAVNTNGNVVSGKTTLLIGSYDFKVVKINAGWQNYNNDTNVAALATTLAATAGKIDRRHWVVGAQIPVFGKDLIKVAYNRVNWKSISGNDSNLWSLGYVHPLSKRTTVYGTWAKMTNQTAATATLWGGPALTTATGAANPGYDPSAVNVGMSHNF